MAQVGPLRMSGSGCGLAACCFPFLSRPGRSPPWSLCGFYKHFWNRSLSLPSLCPQGPSSMLPRLSIFNQKPVSKLSKNDLGCSSLIPDPNFFPSRIPGSKKYRIANPRHWLAQKLTSWSSSSMKPSRQGESLPPASIFSQCSRTVNLTTNRKLFATYDKKLFF